MNANDNLRDRQAFEFGSPSGKEFHEHARQSIESTSKQIKTSSLADLEDSHAGRLADSPRPLLHHRVPRPPGISPRSPRSFTIVTSGRFEEPLHAGQTRQFELASESGTTRTRRLFRPGNGSLNTSNEGTKRRGPAKRRSPLPEPSSLTERYPPEPEPKRAPNKTRNRPSPRLIGRGAIRVACEPPTDGTRQDLASQPGFDADLRGPSLSHGRSNEIQVVPTPVFWTVVGTTLTSG